jgi:hypothetical protein
MPSNNEFLSVLFGADSQWAHVTDFSYDPSNMPDGKSLSAWKGDYFSRYQFGEQTNQYFTISTFMPDEKNVARRRKVLYRYTHVIVLDDVKEKLSLEQAQKLPTPTWVLETSPGSEQWGYVLNEPCSDRGRVENLLDGLVANGLAPDGKDPGMKGVTRYVRLPEGYNNKASKLVNGQPFKCRITEWNPFYRVTLEQLAEPFAVNLNAVRRETRVDGAADVSDHPLLSVADLIHIKEERSDGRFDITCPWVDEHTDGADNGAAIFTNSDGTIGFKCHHGSCQSRTGASLLRYIDNESAGFSQTLKAWQVRRSFDALPAPVASSSETVVTSFLEAAPTALPTPVIEPGTDVAAEIQKQLNSLKQIQPFAPEARTLACTILKVVDDLPSVDKIHWHNEIKDTMRWTKPELKEILKSLREEWYISKSDGAIDFFSEVIFIRELNQFYDRARRIFYSPEAYQNTYAHLDPEARKQALQGGLVVKVDRMDYAPLMPAVFTDKNVSYGNSWTAEDQLFGVPGDISRWLQHFVVLGWGANRDHVLQWMAWTLLHPDVKINHMLILGGAEGVGKDFLLYPLTKAMGNNFTQIEGEELLSQFQDYMLHTKYLHINETELGDRKEAQAVSNKLKPLAAAPPEKLRINQKGIKPISVRNIASVSMSTNSQLPFRINNISRRMYALWSDLKIRDEKDNMIDGWKEYWVSQWEWMNNGGAEQVIYYLRNNVDLSNFNPGVAPPVTDFLRNIKEASKSPMQQTIEAFIARRVGCFKCDIVTAGDIATTIKGGGLLNEDIVFCDYKLFTPTKIGCVLRDISGPVQMRARKKYGDMQVWVIRNYSQYQNMTQGEIFDQYERQMIQAKSEPGLKAV